MRDVERRLYLHFKSKEELEKSIYEHIASRIKDEILRVDHDPLLGPRSICASDGSASDPFSGDPGISPEAVP